MVTNDSNSAIWTNFIIQAGRAHKCLTNITQRVNPFLISQTGMQQTKFNLLVHVPTLYLNSGQGTPRSGITEVARKSLHLFSEAHHKQVKRCCRVVFTIFCKLAEVLFKRVLLLHSYKYISIVTQSIEIYVVCILTPSEIHLPQSVKLPQVTFAARKKKSNNCLILR